MDATTPPLEFGPDEAGAVIEASDAAFATLAQVEVGTDWRSADAFPRRFSSDVAGYLLNGHGFALPAAPPGDLIASAAVRIVQRAARYALAEIAQAGGNPLTPGERALIDAFREQAAKLSRNPAKAAAIGAAVCRLLRTMFALIGIPAELLPSCYCTGAALGSVAARLSPPDAGQVVTLDAASTQGTADRRGVVLDPAYGERQAAAIRPGVSIPAPAAASVTTNPASQQAAEVAGLIAAAETAPAANGLRRAELEEVRERHADGTGGPLEFWYASTLHRFDKSERRYYNLLVAMWPLFRVRGTLTAAHAVAGYESAGGSAVNWSKLQEYAKKLNDIIAGRLGLPSKLEWGADFLRWSRSQQR